VSTTLESESPTLLDAQQCNLETCREKEALVNAP
jgi:hypothetical protein